MLYQFRPINLVGFATILAGVLSFASLHSVHAQIEKKDSKPQLRFICVTGLDDEQELILASRDEEQAWTEYNTFKVRSSFITEWIPAKAGELHLAVRGEEGLVSICRFKYPAGTKRAMAILLPDPVTKGYSADVINPGKLNFTKGSALVVNYSRIPGAIALGSAKKQIKPGERMILKPVAEANGMYRMLVAFTTEKNELVTCYDRYVPNNEDARDMIFLLPDQTLGLKVFSLSEFGPFE